MKLLKKIKLWGREMKGLNRIWKTIKCFKIERVMGHNGICSLGSSSLSVFGGGALLNKCRMKLIPKIERGKGEYFEFALKDEPKLGDLIDFCSARIRIIYCEYKGRHDYWHAIGVTEK
jgi:hypothetical protein